jgi:hypothetical protein
MQANAKAAIILRITGPAVAIKELKRFRHCEAHRDEAIQRPSFRDGASAPDPESRDSGFDAEPVIGPRFARTRWHRPGMTHSAAYFEATFGLP